MRELKSGKRTKRKIRKSDFRGDIWEEDGVVKL